MKLYHTQHMIGLAKYVVSFHDGEKKHADGSPFFDLRIFANKRKFASFTRSLDKDGYTSPGLCRIIKAAP